MCIFIPPMQIIHTHTHTLLHTRITLRAIIILIDTVNSPFLLIFSFIWMGIIVLLICKIIEERFSLIKQKKNRRRDGILVKTFGFVMTMLCWVGKTIHFLIKIIEKKIFKKRTISSKIWDFSRFFRHIRSLLNDTPYCTNFWSIQ